MDCNFQNPGGSGLAGNFWYMVGGRKAFASDIINRKSEVGLK